MDATRLRLVTDDSPEIRLASFDEPLRWRERASFRCVPQYEHSVPLRRAIAQGRQAILAEQRPDGSFCSPRVDDPITYSLFVLLHAYLDQSDDRVAYAAERLLKLQSHQGGWSRLAGEADDLSTTVLAYFALKLTGHRSNTLPMQAAMQAISQAGGAAACDAQTRLLLALFGQIPYSVCAAPGKENAATAIYAQQPQKSLPLRQGVRELYTTDPITWPVCQWRSDNTATEFENHVWQLLALTTTGDIEQDGSQHWKTLLKQFGIDDPTTIGEDNDEPTYENAPSDHDECRLLLSSGHTAISDTARALTTLKASGLSTTSPAVRHASRWLEAQLKSGHVTQLERAGVQSALKTNEYSSHEELPPELELWSKEGPNRVHDGEAKDGSAASPFQTQHVDDHKLDDASVTRLRAAQRPDGSWNANGAHTAAADNAVSLDVMRLDGPRSLVNATAATLSALAAAGLDASDETIAVGVNWLVCNQRSDGGWDESSRSGESFLNSGSFHQANGPSDASTTAADSTARAILALVDCNEQDAEVIESGIDFLLAEQSNTGGWLARDDDTAATLDLRTTCRAVEALSRWATVGTRSKGDLATRSEFAAAPKSRMTRQPALQISPFSAG